MQDTHSHLTQKILRFVAKNTDGASVTALSEALPQDIARRTLQRLLADLVEAKLLVRTGAGRGARYRIVTPAQPRVAESTTERTAKTESHLTLSSKAIALKQRVNQPPSKRKPVAYRREFLASYQPNKTYYLDATLRKELEDIAPLAKDNLDAGTYATQLYQRLLIDLSWNSSRLEGNTYSLLETSRLIDFGESSVARNAIETQMILNHKAAIEFLITNHNDIGINNFTVLNVHALLSENLLDSAQAEGRLRHIAIGIGGSVYRPVAEPQRVLEYFDVLLKKAQLIKNPFEQAFFLMVQLPYLQPFEDVNKRVSRLVANIPFIQRNLCPLSFVDVPDKDYIDGLLAVYELNDVTLLKEVFVWAYRRSAARYAAVRHALGEPDPFKLRYRNEIKEAVAAIIRAKLAPKAAIEAVQNAALKVPTTDRKTFIDVVEGELVDVHEGNFAKFGIRPSEFSTWYKVFKRGKK